jgi:hypothetical protein
MARSKSSILRALRDLQVVATETDKALDRLVTKSEELSKRSSTALVGAFGGLVGIALAYGISLAGIGASFLIAGPILSGIGVVGGLLLMRGRGRIRFERAIDNNRMVANEVLDRIRTLESLPDPPREATEDLWTTYRSLTSSLHNEAANMNKESKIPELKLLPSPSSEPLRLMPQIIDADFVPAPRPASGGGS